MAQISHDQTLKEKYNSLLKVPGSHYNPARTQNTGQEPCSGQKPLQHLSAMSILRAGQIQGLLQPQPHSNMSSEHAENHHPHQHQLFPPARDLECTFPHKVLMHWNARGEQGKLEQLDSK